MDKFQYAQINSRLKKIEISEVAQDSNIGCGTRGIKRSLLRKYKKFFTQKELKTMYKMTLLEIDQLIDKKVGPNK